MEPEQESNVLVEEKPLSVWNTFTPLSKYLAMALFVTLPFIGGWIGYTFAPVKVVEVDKVVEVEKIVEIERETEISRQISNSIPDITGECFHDINSLEPVYTQVESSFLNQYPAYETLYRSWSADKTKPKARLYSDALFGCELSNGNLMASFIYSNTNYPHNNPDEPRHRFRLIQFDETGNILEISPENEAPSIGGTFEIVNVNEGVFKFISEVVDPCYSASHSYSYDLNSNTYREFSKGGQIPNCRIPSPGALQ